MCMSLDITVTMLNTNTLKVQIVLSSISKENTASIILKLNFLFLDKQASGKKQKNRLPQTGKVQSN